jgi:CelD/BcsL family acetyltransferase involved in cellulose biosynthesis
MTTAAPKLRHEIGRARADGAAPADRARLEAFLHLVCDLGIVRAPRLARAYLERMFRGVALDGRRVLDIGGGDGMHSYYAALMGAREVVCLEPGGDGSDAQAAGRFARLRAAMPDLPVHLDRRTIQQYSDPGEFNVILMMDSINHLDEQACARLLDDPGARSRYRAVLARIASLAAPGAKLVVTDCSRSNFFPSLRIRNPLAPGIEWQKHQAPQTWVALLDEVGFVNPRISWEPLYRLGRAGRWLLSNKAAAYFLKGVFRLEAERPSFAPGGRLHVTAKPESAADDVVSIHQGADAWALLAERGLLRNWEELAAACPWATPYQSSYFVTTWLRHYRTRYSPVVVTMRARDGTLSGLLVLALSRNGRRLEVAGAHQAEYQAWLAKPGGQLDFIERAVALVDRVLPGHDLKFKYLPRGLPIEEIRDSTLFRARGGITAHSRPLMRLDPDQLDESLRKKSNKSRWARLRRLGPLEFTRITDPQAFAAVFDPIIASYDERQGAANGVLPFAQDPDKKAFHLDLMRGRPGFLHVTVTTLSGKVIAAHIGVAGTSEVHLAIVCHSQAHAEHSPGKLHLLRLGRMLAQEGVQTLDLTPGGDWKERFANARDDVYILTIDTTPTARQVRKLKAGARRVLKHAARAVGVSAARGRRLVVRLRRLAGAT